MGIIRMSCVFGAIMFALPMPATLLQASNASYSSSWPIMSVATESFKDMKSFCAAQETICSSADYVAGRIHDRASYGVQVIFDWANESLATQHAFLPRDEAAADMIETGSVTATGAVVLTISDLVAGWRGSIFPDKG